jgi:hypothetical protein
MVKRGREKNFQLALQKREAQLSSRVLRGISAVEFPSLLAALDNEI